jgi:phosphoribosylamine--glycine ligase
LGVLLKSCAVPGEVKRVKVLVVGGGGREHAIAWTLVQSSSVSQVFCAPGNGGTAGVARCQNLAIGAEDLPALVEAAIAHQVDLVVVGPEVPLALGLADQLQAQAIPVFGPTQAGAQIEASKAWAKDLMAAAGIPTAQSQVFREAAIAQTYVRSHGLPIVIKADGLAAGKGVTVATTMAEALEAIDAAFGGQFGAAGQRLVIEDYLEGEEVSILAITDGLTLRPLLPAQDHKRIGDGDTGPNTGGMGAYAPAPVVTPELQARIQAEILEPAIATLHYRGIDYRGVLYAGLMITPAGDPQVIEFNCRFGDPETQAILPLLATPLVDLLWACVEQRLADLPAIAWKSQQAACVVLSAAGYPGAYAKGDLITGVTEAESLGALVFQAGTRCQEGRCFTNGGRVLGVTGLGTTFSEAIAHAYAAVERIQFDGRYYRKDIGHRVLRKQS